MFNYKNLPKDIRQLIKEQFEPYSSLVPKWCREVVLIYNPQQEEDAVLSCSADFKYRNAVIMVYPNFFYVETEHHIIHEILHIYVAEFSNRVEDILNEVLPEELKPLLIKDINSREEGFVEDLSLTIYELFKKRSKK